MQQDVKTYSNEDLEELLREALDHLTEGRHRVALQTAQTVFDARPGDFRSAICLAWASLENGEPNNALEYADIAVKLGNELPQTRLYRGFILMRLGIFDGAIKDLDSVIRSGAQPLAWAYHLKAKSLAGLGNYPEALKEFDLAIKADGGANKLFPKLREWYRNASGQTQNSFLTKLKEKEKPSRLLEEAEEAFKAKEYWYVMWAVKRILADFSKADQHRQAKILELETMHALFQIKPAIIKAESLKDEYGSDPRFDTIYKKLISSEQKKHKPAEQKKSVIRKEINLEELAAVEIPVQKTPEPEPEPEPAQVIDALPKSAKPLTLKRKTEFQRFDNQVLTALYAKTYDLMVEYETGQRVYHLQFAEHTIRYIAVEVIISNPFYQIKDSTLTCFAVWYVNDDVVGQNEFEVPTDRQWKNVVFIQSWGAENPGFWKRGQGRVEIYCEKVKICERWYLVGANDIVNHEEVDIDLLEKELGKKGKQAASQPSESTDTASPQPSSDLETLLKELEGYIGLTSVKQAMRDFVDYLKFINERKKLGLKTQDKISLHSVFLGNPGTGKTTIARIVGNIFKAMGILEKGHVVEVDRSALVGQYVGETAQKTEKIIEDSMGGVLFVDEAYTLVKKGGGGQDFGQEAIDTLLKRMEDKSGQFAVIAAGYPDEMNDFLSSNPGMKSRFTHFFDFEDYTPEEMIRIFQMISKKEEYNVDPGAVEVLLKLYTDLYRKRDKTFGNGRLVRNTFDEAKLNLSKRYLKLPENMRDKDALTTIKAEDIQASLQGAAKKDFKTGIDEEKLTSSLKKLNSLTGLATVKKDINELVKLARYYIEQGDSIQNRFTDHILFLGNPGTGKTTVARIVSEIYSALGLLPKGQLIEADRQMLVASFVGKTAEKTTEVINQSMGGTLFIDEAYTLVKGGDSSDFGKEAIDTLLKRMEDDKGKFIVIAAGYTDDMKKFLESNPGLQSRFTKYFTFEDYAPPELMTIAKVIFGSKNLKLDAEAEQKLGIYFNEIYRSRDKNFGNARLVRNLVDGAVRAQLLRLVDLPKELRTEDLTQTIAYYDLQDMISTKSEKKVVAVEGNKEELDKYLRELNELTGLDSVKKSVEKLLSSIKVAKLREERGLKVLQKNLHSIFLGNPGTGKTTVARLISKIFKEMGIISKGHLVEVDRSALVAGYQGQTAIKTEEVIQKAIGGTLFIDEAYTLARGGNDFGQEAIETLLKRMEDLKDELVVIVAGYTNEMQAFLDANPGMRSRFTNSLVFEDYTPRQMLEIASMIGEKTGYHLDEGALQLLLEIFQRLYDNRDKNFGNARTVRNILYKAISNQEERILTLVDPSDSDLTLITIEDVRIIDVR
ncbi:MAG: AAA family ATPase [Ignavibacteriaceae bacterium]|nr:AAA family ATPase [Ignavibacteriaceae bacterium]